jgi:hypothetical protein
MWKNVLIVTLLGVFAVIGRDFFDRAGMRELIIILLVVGLVLYVRLLKHWISRL